MHYKCTKRLPRFRHRESISDVLQHKAQRGIAYECQLQYLSALRRPADPPPAARSALKSAPHWPTRRGFNVMQNPLEASDMIQIPLTPQAGRSTSSSTETPQSRNTNTQFTHLPRSTQRLDFGAREPR